jgi:hypothetical protein
VLVLCEAKYCARESVLYVPKVAQIFIANVLRRNKTELMLLTSATKYLFKALLLVYSTVLITSLSIPFTAADLPIDLPSVASDCRGNVKSSPLNGLSPAVTRIPAAQAL